MGFRKSSSSQIYIWIQLEWSGVKLLSFLCKRHTTFARACTEWTKAHHWMYIDTLRTDLGPDVSDGVGAYLVSPLEDVTVYLRQPRHDTGAPQLLLVPFGYGAWHKQAVEGEPNDANQHIQAVSTILRV